MTIDEVTDLWSLVVRIRELQDMIERLKECWHIEGCIKTNRGPDCVFSLDSGGVTGILQSI